MVICEGRAEVKSKGGAWVKSKGRTEARRGDKMRICAEADPESDFEPEPDIEPDLDLEPEPLYSMAQPRIGCFPG